MKADSTAGIEAESEDVFGRCKGECSGCLVL